MTQKSLVVLLFVMQGIPLLAFPGVLVADVMLLASDGEFGGGARTFTHIMLIVFIILITSYPLTYLLSILIYKITKSKRMKFWASIATFIHYAVVILFSCFAVLSGI